MALHLQSPNSPASSTARRKSSSAASPIKLPALTATPGPHHNPEFIFETEPFLHHHFSTPGSSKTPGSHRGRRLSSQPTTPTTPLAPEPPPPKEAPSPSQVLLRSPVLRRPVPGSRPGINTARPDGGEASPAQQEWTEAVSNCLVSPGSCLPSFGADARRSTVGDEIAQVAICGAGPGGLGPLVRASRLGVLEELLGLGTVLIDAQPAARCGGGALAGYQIRSNTSASCFLAHFLKPREGEVVPPVWRDLGEKRVTAQMAAFGHQPAPLPLIGEFLQEAGACLRLPQTPTPIHPHPTSLGPLTRATWCAGRAL